MRVLVTGANGMLGTDLCAMLEAGGHEAIRTDVGARENVPADSWEHLDITSPQNVADVILKHQPDAVVHTAAYTDVDGCERNPDRAYLLNAQGTWNVAAVCGAHNIALAYVSTDFVFDGTKTTPYTEFDTVNPLSHYGASKLAGEKLVAQLCRKHYTIRTQWLYGAHGKCFPATMLNLAQTRKDLNVVVDQVGSPTHTVDLARTIIMLLHTPMYGTYHVANAGQCSWAELAQRTFELAGVTHVTVHPVPASEYPSPTRRPAYSVMRRYALELQGRDNLPPWQQSLAEFIALKKQQAS